MEENDFQKFNKARKIHFIGIGGIGVSAVAKMMIAEGKKVSGSDISLSKITEELQNLGAEIFEGHKKENLKDDVDLVVYTVALSSENPEILEARKRGIPIISYPEALGVLSAGKFTVAVSGTHGKTTTTAMVTEILIEAELSPTVIVGSLMKSPEDGRESNFIKGQSEYFVVEACEYKESFLELNPNVLVITNIEEDHLDFYKDLAEIKSAFKKLAEKVSEEGFVVCDSSNPNLKEVLSGLKCRVIDYKKNLDTKMDLQVPGEYNRENASAALAVAEILGVNKSSALRSLSKFSGTWRRFEFKGENQSGDLFFDDYAHHPTEIKSFLKALKEKFPSKEVVAIFQPHLYSRTKILLDDLAQSFNLSDEVILAPVYAAREEPEKGVSSEVLQEKMTEFHQNVFLAKSLKEAADMILSKQSKKEDRPKIFATIGAGDVFKVYENFSLKL